MRKVERNRILLTNEYKFGFYGLIIIFKTFISGLLALAGVDISSDIYAWIVVIVLPIYSALNPFIYTLSMVYKKKVSRKYDLIVHALNLKWIHKL